MEAPIIDPLGIPEILLHVLYYVGGLNSRDLSPCRLVNRTWNNVATELLKKNGICISLNNDNIQPYIELLEICHAQRRNSEEELDSDNEHHDTQPLEKLNLIVQMPRYDSSCVYGDDVGNLSGFHPMVKKVQKLIGSYNCVIEEIVDTHNLIGDPSFCQLLQLISPSIKTLHVEPRRKDSVDFEGSHFHSGGPEEENTVPIPGSFPKLECIKYVIPDELLKPKLFKNLIESARTLRTLIVRGYFSQYEFHVEEDGRLSFNKSNQSEFVTEIIRGLAQPNNETPLALTQLELPIYNQDSLNSLCQLVLPKLQNLKLHQKITCMASKSFCVFLAKNCPCLDHLELLFLPFCKPPGNEDRFDPLDSSNPAIRQITHVGLYFLTTGNMFDAEAISQLHKEAMITSSGIISSQFQSLTSIGADLCGLGSLTFAQRNFYQEPTELPPNLQSFYSAIKFPHVSSLSISLSHQQTFLSLNYGRDDDLFVVEYAEDNSETEEDVGKDITAYVESIFPSLTKLVVTQEDDDENHLDAYLSHLSGCWGIDGWIRNSGLKSILRMNGPGIQSLEVNNYFEWFQFLAEDDDENILDNLWESVTQLKFGGDPNANPFNIMDIQFEHFPNLESIQIQEEILTTKKKSNGKAVPFEDVLDQLSVFRASYPNINIQLW